MSDPLASIPLSYAAYAEIPADGQRWEFLDGEVFVTPAPSPAHQFAVLRLGRFLEDNLAAFGDDAIAFISPIDVILNDSEIVQPDVVVARRAQVSSRGIEGAPPLLVEVVSPTRPGLDREIKARRYAANGVTRFWLADPVARTMECFRLVAAEYQMTASAGGNALLDISDLPGLSLPLERLWLT
jgi:Uma2 family endonuclease